MRPTNELKAPPGKFRELWKPCLKGYYEVSNFGRLRRAKPGKGTWVGREIALFTTRKGYVFGHVYAGVGKVSRVSFFIHVLVAEAFVGPCPDGMEVNHIDLCKANNRWDNLEYKTHLDNVKHAGENGHSGGAPKGSVAGERNGRAKLTRVQVEAIRRLYAEDGYTHQELAAEFAEFGVTKGTIGRIVRRQLWA
jgi:HNH endonuclease